MYTNTAIGLNEDTGSNADAETGLVLRRTKAIGAGLGTEKRYSFTKPKPKIHKPTRLLVYSTRCQKC